MSNHIGGYRFNLEDVDYLLANQMKESELLACTSVSMDRPKEIDPRPWSPMRNQSNEGSCQGHAIAAAGEGCYYVGTKQFQPFSPDLAYYLTQQIDGIRGDRGSTIAGGMKMAATIGFAPESFMPYTPKYNPQDIPSDYKEVCAPNKVNKYTVIKTFQQAFDWISLGLGFISYGLAWNVSISNTGVMSWSPGGGGGHANAIMGYGANRDSDGLPDFLWGKNSWGDWEVLRGWYKITRSTFEKFARDRNTVIVGISDMSTPKPRKINFLEKSVIQ